MIDSESNEDFFSKMIKIDTKKREKEEEEKKREKRLINTIDRLKEDYVIPIESLNGIKIGKEPMHLNRIETDIFRFFEVNRTKAYTFLGLMHELMDPRSPSLCPNIEPLDPTSRANAMDTLKDMVLKGKIGGMYEVNKKDFFYFFKT